MNDKQINGIVAFTNLKNCKNDNGMLSYFDPPFIAGFSERKIPGFLGVCYQCNFDEDNYSDSNVIYFLGENLHESLVPAVLKRKAEFVAGRYLARRALVALGACSTSVGIGINRAPIWPNSFLGSISHSKSFAICAVTHRKETNRIGIDIEDILNVEVAKDIVGSVLTKSEHQLVGSAINPNPVVLTLIFSAKESLFKALYPEVGRYFDFHAARIKEINFITCQITLELVQELGPTLRVGTRFSGGFELDSTKVFTIIT